MNSLKFWKVYTWKIDWVWVSLPGQLSRPHSSCLDIYPRTDTQTFRCNGLVEVLIAIQFVYRSSVYNIVVTKIPAEMKRFCELHFCPAFNFWRRNDNLTNKKSLNVIIKTKIIESNKKHIFHNLTKLVLFRFQIFTVKLECLLHKKAMHLL